MPKTVITITKGRDSFTYSTLKKACESNPSFRYNHLKALKFPFYYKGWEFVKAEVISGKNEKE